MNSMDRVMKDKVNLYIMLAEAGDDKYLDKLNRMGIFLDLNRAYDMLERQVKPALLVELSFTEQNAWMIITDPKMEGIGTVIDFKRTIKKSAKPKVFVQDKDGHLELL